MTLAYFPQPRPDELLYSLLARWRQHVGLPASTDATRALFGGKARHKTPFDLPIQLDALVRQIPLGQGMTADRLIDEHTLFPYLTAFMPEERALRIRGAMRSPGGTPYNYLGAREPGRDYVSRLRFCPSCLQEMTAEYGEPYWKRSHQLPSSFVCDVHGDILADSGVEISRFRNGYESAAMNCSGERPAADLPPVWKPVLFRAARAGAGLLGLKRRETIRAMQEALQEGLVDAALAASLDAARRHCTFLPAIVHQDLLQAITVFNWKYHNKASINSVAFGSISDKM